MDWAVHILCVQGMKYWRLWITFCSIKDSLKLHNNQTDRNSSVMGQNNTRFNAELRACYVHVTKSLAHLANCTKITLDSDMIILYHLYRLFIADEHVSTATFMAEN